ncbi:response regulator [Candidatus Halobeggiatoa sp. HSG11]|nr:response regulator [Candidatus Halobeggiatoa sp. HSG11]
MREKSTVYVIDDDQTVCDLLQAWMDLEKIPVQTYLSAREFLANYDLSKLDCLILDVEMPNMSGLELQEYFNRQKITIPIIIMTGYADVSMAVEAMKAGALDFFEKPLIKRFVNKTGKGMY